MNRTPLPGDHPDARPAAPVGPARRVGRRPAADFLVAHLDLVIAQTDNPLLRERLQQFAQPWRDAARSGEHR